MRNQHEPFYFAPQPKLGGGWICFKDSPSPPPPPDYKGAAEATALSQKTSQYTPYGNLVYSSDTSSPSGYKSTINLAPEAQQTLDTQMGLSREMGDITRGQLPGVAQQYGTPMDLSSVPQIADKAYETMTARLDPQWERRESAERTRLANQGLVPGGEAYGNAMTDLNQARNDAYQQANLGAISTMPQTYQMANAAYNQPLNIMNALRTGAQIQNPQFQSPGAGTNYMGAAQGQNAYDLGLYNTGVGQANSFNSGLFSLGSAGLGAYGAYLGAAASDRRLKSNIVRIGTHPLGIGVYEYDIFGHREQGVMADEVLTVKPEAVATHPSGYLMVDYGRL